MCVFELIFELFEAMNIFYNVSIVFFYFENGFFFRLKHHNLIF